MENKVAHLDEETQKIFMKVLFNFSEFDVAVYLSQVKGAEYRYRYTYMLDRPCLCRRR